MGNRIFDFLGQLSVGLLVSVGLEDWVPSEVSAASWLHDFSWSLANKQKRLLELSTHVGDDAHRVSGLILEGLDHLGQSLGTDALQEPFDVWSRQALIGVVAKRSILDQNWLLGLLESNENFFPCNLLRFSLQFRHYIILHLRSTFSFLKSN